MKINKNKFSDMTANNHIMIVAIMLLFSLSIITQTGVAQIINKVETVGPFQGGHTYQIEFFNYDDVTGANVNGNVIGPFSGGQIQVVDITGDLFESADNVINFGLTNNFGGWTYGFALIRDNSKVLWVDSCGELGSVGCMGGDQTLGSVVRDALILPGQEPLFVFIRGSDNALWYRTFGNGAWSGWTSLGGSLNSDPDPVNINDDIFVFVQGSDHALWFREYQFQIRQWSNWVSLGGIGTSGPGAANNTFGNGTQTIQNASGSTGLSAGALQKIIANDKLQKIIGASNGTIRGNTGNGTGNATPGRKN